jgi:hypothetical protein
VVITLTRPRATPRQPLARINRTMVQRATGTPCRCRYAQIFTAPYSDSGGRLPCSSGS